MLRVLELKDAAIDTFETESMALDWMRRPHPMLDGESPLESAATSFGSRRVREDLLAIQYGGVVWSAVAVWRIAFSGALLADLGGSTLGDGRWHTGCVGPRQLVYCGASRALCLA